MKLKIMLLGILIATGPQFAAAISIGSISDSVANSLGSGDQPTYTAAIPKNTNTKQSQAVTAKPQPATQSVTHETKSTEKPAASPSLPNPALFIEDAAMTGYIHAQLLLHTNMPAVRITTQNAVVSLSGTVETRAQADTLIKIAYSVKGVKYVNTEQLVIRREG